MENTPSLQAFLVCDQVIEDKANGKKSIIGTFTHIFSESFPCLHPQLGVYFCITDAEGAYDFTLELIYLDADQLIGKGVVPGIKINNRLDIVDFGLMLPQIVFQGPGRYEFRLSANGKFIGLKDFNLILQQPPSGT
jgi:hypothetical protein